VGPPRFLGVYPSGRSAPTPGLDIVLEALVRPSPLRARQTVPRRSTTSRGGHRTDEVMIRPPRMRFARGSFADAQDDGDNHGPACAGHGSCGDSANTGVGAGRVPGTPFMRGIVKRRWGTCIAILIGMALLGHDLLMTGDVHAFSAVRDGGVQSPHHHASSEVQGNAGHRAPAQERGVGHDSGLRDCSSIRLLVLRVGSSPDLEATPAAVAIAEPVWTVRVPGDTSWREPNIPADIARALFQVYLI